MPAPIITSQELIEQAPNLSNEEIEARLRILSDYSNFLTLCVSLCGEPIHSITEWINFIRSNGEWKIKRWKPKPIYESNFLKYCKREATIRREK